MITHPVRAFAAAVLALLPLVPAIPAHAETTTLYTGITALPVADESREGYERSRFRHWIDADHDGCPTRAEVLIEEAVLPPAIGAGCRLTGGAWHSYYDETTVAGTSGLDVDHMVPLAEAWDSGASAWSAARREAYSNDLGAEGSLVAVTARSNRSKSDQDPAEWMPPAASARCRYLGEWVGDKLRWNLTVDPTEQNGLVRLSRVCPDVPLEYTPVP